MPMKDRKRRHVVSHRVAVGRIGRKGAGRNGARGHPTKLDHFEITSSAMNDAGDFPRDKEAHDKLADYDIDTEKPTKVPIRVDSDNIDDFLVQEYECRRKNARGDVVVWCHGDGETAQRLGNDGKTWAEVPCMSKPESLGGGQERYPKDLIPLLKAPGKDPLDKRYRCPFAQNGDNRQGPTCKPKTEMLFRLEVVNNIGSRARFRSHAHGTADELRNSLEDIKDLMPGGVLQHVPLMLVVRKKQTSYQGGKATWQPAVSARLAVGIDKALELVNHQLQARAQIENKVQEVRLLEAARTETATDEEVEAEWYADDEKPSGGFDGEDEDEQAADSDRAATESGEAEGGADGDADV